MKLIKAIIKPFKLEAVRDALVEIGVSGMTMSEVQGCSRNEKGPPAIHQVFGRQIDFLPKLSLEFVVSDEKVAEAIEVIIRTARTGATNAGKIGDGMIIVSPVDQIIRIRTGERDKAALE